MNYNRTGGLIQEPMRFAVSIRVSDEAMPHEVKMARFSFEYDDNFSLLPPEGFFEDRRYKCTCTDEKTGDTFDSDWYETRKEARADALSQAKSAAGLE
jgi:hypothetical protein